MSPLLIGMIIVGFGTSAPEMIVSAIAAYDGNPTLALGNAYGSNIINIALILGATAIIAPITVHLKIVKKEPLPFACNDPLYDIYCLIIRLLCMRASNLWKRSD